MVNNHNHSSDSVDQDGYELTQSEFTTGSAISPFLSTGSVLTLDELPISSSGDRLNPSASPPFSSSSSSSTPANPFASLQYSDQQQMIPMSSSSHQMMTASPPPLSPSFPSSLNSTESDLHRLRWVDYRSRAPPRSASSSSRCPRDSKRVPKSSPSRNSSVRFRNSSQPSTCPLVWRK